MPVKVHLIIHHLSDYFEATEKTLLKSTDQVVESCHHKVDKFFLTHPNYNHLDKSTDGYGQTALRGVVHLNSNNLGEKWNMTDLLYLFM